MQTANASSSLSQDDFLSELAHLRYKFSNMKPELEIVLRDPAMDVEGFVVVWNTKICEGGPFTRGCGKGGTRIKTGLSLDDVKRLAQAMAQKNAAARLPLGGAKSGLNADPEAPDYEEKFRRFVQLVRDSGILYSDGGIFGGFGYDIGGKPPLNALWTVDELGHGNGFTGKPVDLGGTNYDEEGIAGLGVAVAGKTLIELNGKDAKGQSFAVQGVGAMGGAVIRYFSEYGGVLKSISDPKYDGCWVIENGASKDLVQALYSQDVEKAMTLLNAEAFKKSNDFSGALYEEVDIIFPCALEDSITEQNVHKIHAKFMAEGANNPTTEGAYHLLFEKNVPVVPDIIANPGGIIAAYVELTSDVSNEENIKSQAKVKEAKEITIQRVSENVRQLYDIVGQVGVSPDLVADYMTYKNIFKD